MSMWVPGRFVACVLSVVLAVSEGAHARTPSSSGDPAAGLRAALRAKDIAGVLALLRDPLQHRGIWFADEVCAKQFGAPGRVSGADLVVFARCLVQLELQATSRQIDVPDHAMLTYEPGIELEVAFDHGRVSELGFLYDAEWHHDRPMLTVQAFEALRRTGSPDIDAAVDQDLGPLEKLQVVPMRVWVMVCVDGMGRIDDVVMVKRHAPYQHAEAVSRVFGKAVGATWAFRPFEPRGRVTPACSLMLLSYPAASGSPAERLPAPDVETGPRPPLAPDPLAGLRISSKSSIYPEDITIAQMQHLVTSSVTSSFQLCLDANGAVTGVVMLESSGFPRYDAKVQREMRGWRFEPYRVRGRPVATCAPFANLYDPPLRVQSSSY